ncbi:MAG: hypothetical protein AAGB48_11030 [Planctomycetota bacterium]
MDSTDALGSIRALVSDVYVNLKLSLRLDLPKSRETVPDFFDRVRRRYPQMDSLKKYRDELALETGGSEAPYRWLAVRSRSVRSGVVNPDAYASAHELHEHVLEGAPYFLSISPLDIESVEVLFGLDLLASTCHDEIVYNALLADTALASLIGSDDSVTDCQPVLGWKLGLGGKLEAQSEIKTRLHGQPRSDGQAEPLSVYLTMRRQGPVTELDELGEVYRTLASRGEELVEDRVMPALVEPIRAAILSA